MPKGNVEGLLKPENKDKLANILQHHVMTSALNIDFFRCRLTMSKVDSTTLTYSLKGN